MTELRAHAADALPLLAWPEQREIDRLQVEREALLARIGKLRPHSHYRIELQTRLKVLTARQLELQTRMSGERP